MYNGFNPTRSGVIFVVVPLCSVHLSELAGTTRLDCLDLCLCPRQSLEALGKLRAVEEHALRGFNGTEGPACCAANVAADGRAVDCVQRAVLLCLLSVGRER